MLRCKYAFETKHRLPLPWGGLWLNFKNDDMGGFESTEYPQTFFFCCIIFYYNL